MIRNDPAHDLEIVREIGASPAALWKAWTGPEYLKQWFAPAPVRLTEVEIEPRPGGRFRTVMTAPDGTEYPGDGCILIADPERRLAFTDALGPGWRPAASPFMTAVISFGPLGSGTRYTALVMHKDAADRDRHAEMGFFDGWGTCTDQVAALAARIDAGTA